jgi:hypothetical protein
VHGRHAGPLVARQWCANRAGRHSNVRDRTASCRAGSLSLFLGNATAQVAHVVAGGQFERYLLVDSRSTRRLRPTHFSRLTGRDQPTNAYATAVTSASAISRRMPTPVMLASSNDGPQDRSIRRAGRTPRRCPAEGLWMAAISG